MGRRKTEFWESASWNNATYRQYYNRLVELSLSVGEWKNLPDTVDPRFLELTLFTDGQAVFFKDDVVGFAALQNAIGGDMNMYRIPNKRRAYAVNGFSQELNQDNSVIIWNNLLHTNSMLDVTMYAKRLYNLDRAIDINANAQKTPILIQCDEQQRLTLKNLYMQYDGNAPVIYADRALANQPLNVVATGAPYVCDRLYDLKTQVWNEALTYIGIPNMNITKKSRLVTNEANANVAGVYACRYSRLQARQQACEQINKMFGLNIWYEYRDMGEEDTEENLEVGEGDEQVHD